MSNVIQFPPTPTAPRSEGDSVLTLVAHYTKLENEANSPHTAPERRQRLKSTLNEIDTVLARLATGEARP